MATWTSSLECSVPSQGRSHVARGVHGLKVGDILTAWHPAHHGSRCVSAGGSPSGGCPLLRLTEHPPLRWHPLRCRVTSWIPLWAAGTSGRAQTFLVELSAAECPSCLSTGKFRLWKITRPGSKGSFCPGRSEGDVSRAGLSLREALTPGNLY